MLGFIPKPKPRAFNVALNKKSRRLRASFLTPSSHQEYMTAMKRRSLRCDSASCVAASLNPHSTAPDFFGKHGFQHLAHQKNRIALPAKAAEAPTEPYWMSLMMPHGTEIGTEIERLFVLRDVWVVTSIMKTVIVQVATVVPNCSSCPFCFCLLVPEPKSMRWGQPCRKEPSSAAAAAAEDPAGYGGPALSSAVPGKVVLFWIGTERPKVMGASTWCLSRSCAYGVSRS